jgi:stearoyl-CoA desaturase (delta-9 desaturase)
MSPCQSIKRTNWVNLLFFFGLPLIAAVGIPWYALTAGIAAADWWLFGGFVVATGCSITVGYHRLFAHRAFQASRLVTFLSLVFGAAAFEQSALMWASQHRDHHTYVDTPLDPYSIKKGFWYAHMGWLVFWHQQTDYANVKDLAADPLVRHQHRYYLAWALATGVALPLAIGVATGHLLGAFLLGVVARLTLVHHSTFCINSVCHTFGRATYDLDCTARDHWLVALLTNGEGYHNFHHRFASDYRNGVRWYQWDPSKWAIVLMSWIGLARRLHRVSPQTILAARMAAERQRVERALARQRPSPRLASTLAAVRERYEALKDAVYAWERAENAYRALRERTVRASRAYVENLKAELLRQRRGAALARRRWVACINANPLIPRAAHV